MAGRDLPVNLSPDADTEAKALLAARLSLFRLWSVEPPKTAVEEAERSLLKSVTTSFLASGGGDSAVERLVEEWKKFAAQQEKLKERRLAAEAIGQLLDRRWDELVAAYPSKAIESSLEQHKQALESRREDQDRALEALAGEIKWTEKKLKDLHKAGSSAAAAGEHRTPKKKD